MFKKIILIKLNQLELLQVAHLMNQCVKFLGNKVLQLTISVQLVSCVCLINQTTMLLEIVKEVCLSLNFKYMLIIIGVIVIIIGNLLMIGGGSEDPNVFAPEIFNHL